MYDARFKGDSQGIYDVHEHDVLLQNVQLPNGYRQLPCFSSLTNVHADRGDIVMGADGQADHLDLSAFLKAYKVSGLAVTPYTPRLSSSQFDTSQVRPPPPKL